MTKRELEQLTLLNKEIGRDLERLHELHAVLTGCASSISGLPHIGVLRDRDRTGQFVSTIELLQDTIVERVLDSVTLYIQINAFINSIDDPMIRQIIALRYLDGLSWRQVSQKIGSGISVSGVRMLLTRYLATENQL